MDPGHNFHFPLSPKILDREAHTTIEQWWPLSLRGPRHDCKGDKAVTQGVVYVALGTGIVTRLAAQRLGPTGNIAGLGADANMLTVALSVSSAIHLPIEWHERSTAEMPLADSAKQPSSPTSQQHCNRILTIRD